MRHGGGRLRQALFEVDAFTTAAAEVTALHGRGRRVICYVNADASDFDFAVNEECFRYDECDALEPFVTAGKAVFHVEYDLATTAFCAKAKACLLYTSPSPRDRQKSRMPSSA